MAWKRSSVRSRPGPPTLTVMPAVYILQSESSRRFYIGCSQQPSARLAEHQRGQTLATRGRGPWNLVYQEHFDTLSEARGRERQLKSWKSHRSIQELIDASKVHI
jgi:putative endonuclease